MGKGDKKSKRGKIIRGSYGVRRPHKVSGTITFTKEPSAAVSEETKTKDDSTVIKAKAAPRAKPAVKPAAKSAARKKE